MPASSGVAAQAAPAPAAQNAGAATPAPAQAAPAQAAPVMKGGSRKMGGSKKVGGKKSRKMPTAAKSWVNFVMEVFNKNRAKNPSYKYKQAMKDAAKLKKKNKTMKMGGSALPAPASVANTAAPAK